MEKKVHLTEEGLKKIRFIKASLNKIPRPKGHSGNNPIRRSYKGEEGVLQNPSQNEF